jgi:flagellar P-ring protein precursor FlgI
MDSSSNRKLVVALLAAWWCAAAVEADAKAVLKTLCRVKGQEENTLQGLGLVVGLKGTGDGGSSLPTMRSLAQAMQYLGNPTGKTGLAELKDAKNVALVLVTATVPAAGARQGDKIDCTVSSVGSAKSLAGGRLFTTLLTGPDPKNPRVYATAEGAITLDNLSQTTTGRIHAGCRLEEDFFNAFSQDGKITLVLDKNHADFQIASDVADLINRSPLNLQSSGAALAKAVNPGNIEVLIPAQYAENPVDFISQVLALSAPEPQVGARVVINERAGSIVISGDVEIGAAVVTHKNVVVETGGTATAARFVTVDSAQSETPKLKALVETLNAVRVPTEDIIEIIKGLDRDGKLHARLIVE